MLLGQHFRAAVAILDQYQPAAFITTEQTTAPDSWTLFQKKFRSKKHVDTENSDSKEKQRAENMEIKIHNNVLTTIYFAGLEEEFANASQIKKKIFYFAFNLFVCLFSRDSFILALNGLELTLKIWKF